jgi:hypothetical protein
LKTNISRRFALLLATTFAATGLVVPVHAAPGDSLLASSTIAKKRDFYTVERIEDSVYREDTVVRSGVNAMQVSLPEGVWYQAVVTNDSLSADSKIRVAGQKGSVTANGGSITVTNLESPNFFLVNDNPIAGDSVWIEFYERRNFEWIRLNTKKISWEDPYLDRFTASYNQVGSSKKTVEVSYSARDQFGKLNDSSSFDSESPLMVTVISTSGVELDSEKNELFEPQTRVLVGGKATISIPNVGELGQPNFALGLLHTEDVDFQYSSGTVGDLKSMALKDQTTEIWRNGETYRLETNRKAYRSNIAYWYEDRDAATVKIRVTYLNELGEEVGSAFAPIKLKSEKHYFRTENVWLRFKNAEALTDRDGIATFQIFSKKVGNEEFVASYDGFTTSANIRSRLNARSLSEQRSAVLTWNWQGVAGGLTEGAPANNTTYNVTVTAKDSRGNPLPWANINVFGQEPNAMRLIGSSGYVNFLSMRTDSKGQASFRVRALSLTNPNKDAIYKFTARLSSWGGYPSYGKVRRVAQGATGAQAQVKRSASSGSLQVGVFNVPGQRVRVYVDGNLVKSAMSSGSSYTTTLSNLTRGDRKITIWAGNKRLYVGVVDIQ